MDENVFEIQQGVSITLARRGDIDSSIEQYDLYGTREQKYSWLASTLLSGTHSQKIEPAAPLFLFRAQDRSLFDEYSGGVPLPELMGENGEPAPGFVTTHDEFAISWTAAEAREKVERFLKTGSEADARKLFTLCSQNQWNYARAKSALSDGKWRKEIVQALYRPFDIRWTIYNSNVAVHRRERVMRHMLGGKNYGIICTRQTKDEWGVLATRYIAAHKTCGAYDINYLFPLWLSPATNELNLGRNERTPNFSLRTITEWSKRLGLTYKTGPSHSASMTPEEIFHYAYAVFYSPGYRSRYAEFLKVDFPRLPLAENRKLFRELAVLGGELVNLHLLESSQLDQSIARFVGGRSEEIEKVSWSDDTVWVDKARTVGFAGVPQLAWTFHIGGYQVCEKWLKDRKGHTLQKSDITHYQKIITALAETIRLMKEIDDVVETYGGWPAAFQSGVSDVAVLRGAQVSVQKMSRYVGFGKGLFYRSLLGSHGTRFAGGLPNKKFRALAPRVLT